MLDKDGYEEYVSLEINWARPMTQGEHYPKGKKYDIENDQIILLTEEEKNKSGYFLKRFSGICGWVEKEWFEERFKKVLPIS